MAIGTSTETRGQLTLRQRYEQTRTELLLERATFEAHWRELGEYLKPRRTRFYTSDRNKGDKRNQNIIDSTPVYALRTLQSGLHAGLTSPARPWMKLTTPDPDLAEFEPVKQWLHMVTRRMLDVFLRSNLYNALPTLYGDMGGFATGAMAALEDAEDLVRFYTYPVGSYAIGLDARGVATTFMRDYQLTALQLVEEFGGADFGRYGSRLRRGQPIDWSNLSADVKAAWNAGNYNQAFDVTWLVCPNVNADASRLAAEFLPWHSCWFERGSTDRFLRSSGFRNFPVLVPRWDVAAEDTYGTDCPGMTALGDIKALQVMHRRKAQAVDKALNPPLIAPAQLRTQKTSLLPGDVTYADVRDGMQGLRPIHEVRLEGVQYMGLDIAQTQGRVSRAFYEDLFLMLANSDRQGGQPVTAREVEERHEEKLLALGPVLERTNDELLDPLVDRVFAVMVAAGAIPEPPEELQGLELKVEYISIMAQAQKLIGVVGQDRFLQSTIGLAQTFPEARHKVNVFQVMDTYADMLGVDPRIVRTDDEAQASLDAEREAQAAAAQAEQMKTAGQAAQALAHAPTTGDTALRAVLDGGMGA